MQSFRPQSLKLGVASARGGRLPNEFFWPTVHARMCIESRIIRNASTSFVCLLRDSLRSLTLGDGCFCANPSTVESYKVVRERKHISYFSRFVACKEQSDPSLVVLSLPRCRRPFRFSSRTRTLSSSFVWLGLEVSVFNPKLFACSVTQLRVRRSYASRVHGSFL